MNFPLVYKSSILQAGLVSIEEVPFSKVKLNQDSLVIKPKFMGICRADIKEVSASRDIMEDRGPLFGHELIGDIVFAGKNTGFSTETHVTFNPNITPQRTTGFAEYFFISGDRKTLQSAIIPIPQDLNFELPPEPFACIVHSVGVFIKHYDFDFKDKNVGIIGAGNSGLMFGFLLKNQNAKVKFFNRGKMRLEFALEKGLFKTDELEKLDEAASFKDSFDTVIVVPTAINSEILKTSIDIVKPGGFIHLYAGTRKGDGLQGLSVDIDKIRRNELSEKVKYQNKSIYISGAYGCLAEDFIKGMELINNTPEMFPLHKLISKTILLSELPGLLMALSSNQVDLPGKVIVINK